MAAPDPSNVTAEAFGSSRACAVIDLTALRHNLREVRRLVGPRVQIWPAVKANAYGHGACCVTRALAEEGADGFCVASAGEALEIASSARDRPILVLGSVLNEDAEAIVASGAQSVVADVSQAALLSDAARKAGRRVSIHLKVDTGMGRIGVRPNDAAEAAAKLDAMPGIRLSSLMTHFAAADGADLSYAREQLTCFKQAAAEVRAKLGRPLQLHCANSGAILSFSESHLDCVRPGLMLYGSFPSPACPRNAELRPVMTLRSRIVFLKDVRPGDSVSYGRTWTAPRRSRIATISIGYGDGLPRRLSNTGRALVKGRLAPVAGRVCMDQTMLDVTGIEGVAVGDGVVFWGVQEGSVLRAEDVAEGIGTIPYELTCQITPRVQRVYIQ